MLGRFMGAIGAAAVACSLVACGDGEHVERKENKPPSEFTANIDDLLKADKTNGEFVQGLRRWVKLVDGMLLVENPMAFGLFALSVNSPWALQCGPGLSLVFGGRVNRDPFQSVGNDVDITLSLTLLSNDRCRELVPLLGREINLILSGN